VLSAFVAGRFPDHLSAYITSAFRPDKTFLMKSDDRKSASGHGLAAPPAPAV